MLTRILHHHLSPYRFGDGRSFRPGRLVSLIIVPVLFAAAISWRAGSLQRESLGNFLTVFSVVAAVMTALLAVVQNSVAAIDAKSKFTPGNAIVHKRQVKRLEVLRELYASIAFAVVLLVFALVPVVVLQLVPSEGWPTLKAIVSWLVYVACTVVGVGSLHIVLGVYRVLDVHADQIAEQLRNNAPGVGTDAPTGPDA